MNILDGDARAEPVDELGAVPRRPVRVHGNESNYRYGIESGACRVLDLLEQRRMRFTATAAALALERAPALARRLVASNCEVACHGYRWVHQYRMGEVEERRFIGDAWRSIEATCGTRPLGWLSRFLHTDNTRRLLLQEGFTYHMDDYSGDMPFWTEVDCGRGHMRPLLIVPYALDTNDMKMWTAPSLSPRDWANYAIDSFEWLLREARQVGPRMMSLGLHLRIIGRPGRIGALARVLDHVHGQDDVWVTTRLAIAEAYADAVPAPASAREH